MSAPPPVDPERPAAEGSPVTRFAWQSGGLVLGRGAALVALVVIARDLGQGRYGEFVILLALLELATVPWKPTVQQGAAARLGRGADQTAWRRAMLFWWAAGSLVVGPIGWAVGGYRGAAAIVAASLANALMIDSVPRLIATGRQRPIAVAMASSQVARLLITVVFVLAGVLTPTWALVVVGLGYLVGAAALRGSVSRAEPTAPLASTGLLAPEVGTETLRWVELHGPIVIVAALLGLDTAGGFDLLYKLAIALAELIAGIGIVLIPALVRSTEPSAVIARGIRLPTAAAAIVAAAFALVASPVLAGAAGIDVAGGAAPVLLAVTMVLAPWMGVSKAALLVTDGAWWLVPSQAAVAVATLVAGSLTTFGLAWAAFAVALAHVAGSAVRFAGLRAREALPALRDVAALTSLREDARWLRRSIQRTSR